MATGWQSYMPTIKHAERSPFAPLTQSHFGKLMDTRCRCGRGPMAGGKGCRGSASLWWQRGFSGSGLGPASPAQWRCALRESPDFLNLSFLIWPTGELFHPHRAGAVVNKTQGSAESLSPRVVCHFAMLSGSRSFLPNVQEQKSA